MFFIFLKMWLFTVKKQHVWFLTWIICSASRQVPPYTHTYTSVLFTWPANILQADLEVFLALCPRTLPTADLQHSTHLDKPKISKRQPKMPWVPLASGPSLGPLQWFCLGGKRGHSKENSQCLSTHGCNPQGRICYQTSVCLNHANTASNLTAPPPRHVHTPQQWNCAMLVTLV